MLFVFILTWFLLQEIFCWLISIVRFDSQPPRKEFHKNNINKHSLYENNSQLQ